MVVERIAPPEPEPTFDVSGLTKQELRALLISLKHCSGGHVEGLDYSSGSNIPGKIYNQITNQLGASENSIS